MRQEFTISINHETLVVSPMVIRNVSNVNVDVEKFGTIGRCFFRYCLKRKQAIHQSC